MVADLAAHFLSLLVALAEDGHGRAGAGAPFFSEWNRMANIRNGVTNMPNAPIELTRFQSANTTL